MMYCLLLALQTASASGSVAPNSAPQPAPIVVTIPPSRDVNYPGTMRLAVDATDIDRAIWKVRQTIPVERAGPMTLLMPAWIPGAHSAAGAVEKLAGLRISAGGRALTWTRDDINVWAFHLDVPAGARQVDIEFDFLSAVSPEQGRIEVTPNLMNLRFESVSLYPAGYFTRRIPVQATVTYPVGWHAASAIPARKAGKSFVYDTVDYETLIDSPVFAGRHFREWALTDRVDLNVFADTAEELAATPDQIAAHRRLIDQSVKLFGSQPYDRYEFLLAITGEMSGIGLEHHRSSENGVRPGYFTKWSDGPGSRTLLPHEFVHSWNGKYRRGAESWTPDFHTPMRNRSLWVYEGQTQFWGFVLQSRAGLVSPRDTLDQLAFIAAALDTRPAREWRSLGDTTNDPIISNRRPKGWVSWQRSEDYYNEGALIWLEIDALLRKLSNGTHSMDSFAAKFFRGNDGDWGTVTYTTDDVVRTLNEIQPYDWNSLIAARLSGTTNRAPLAGLTENGYRLAYSETPPPAFVDIERNAERSDLSYSVGLVMGKGGTVQQVIWNGPAFQAGMTVATTIIAVNGREYAHDVFKAAIKAATAKDAEPVQLTVKTGKIVRTFPLFYHGGLRYPYLERIDKGPNGLDRLLAPR